MAAIRKWPLYFPAGAASENAALDRHFLVRGLRYQDVMSRTATGFVIHRRVHTPLWQTELTTVPPMLA